jgi:hypothetical protein
MSSQLVGHGIVEACRGHRVDYLNAPKIPTLAQRAMSTKSGPRAR